jgi:hypothetical protein
VQERARVADAILDPPRERQRIARVSADEAGRARDSVGNDVCAEAARKLGRLRAASTTSPSSDNAYVPSETCSCATETGITAMPVTDSAAFA